jgi:hypothetical protein
MNRNSWENIPQQLDTITVQEYTFIIDELRKTAFLDVNRIHSLEDLVYYSIKTAKFLLKLIISSGTVEKTPSKSPHVDLQHMNIEEILTLIYRLFSRFNEEIIILLESNHIVIQIRSMENLKMLALLRIPIVVGDLGITDLYGIKYTGGSYSYYYPLEFYDELEESLHFLELLQSLLKKILSLVPKPVVDDYDF